jgi:MFS transporter, YNFM family, putative membrane transport protein
MMPMTAMPAGVLAAPAMPMPATFGLGRFLVVALLAFLTVVDLFAVQAILPSLAASYAVSPAEMGTAVNASTLGMAAGGLGAALFGRRLDRRRGTAASLVILAVPTALLALMPGLGAFAALRIVQGLCMATAFSLALAHLGERYGAGPAAAAAFAAYITGNVASNLVGRLVSASVADRFGLDGNFVAFAALNLAGAALALVAIRGVPAPRAAEAAPSVGAGAVLAHLANADLRAGFGVGFCILFAFIGTFTYVNFVLVAEPFALSPMALGLVYFVFAPSILTTPLAGRLVARFGARRAFRGAIAVAVLGLPPLLSGHLAAVLAGLALVAVGTFLAQAMATGFVGRRAQAERGAASGLYLASYFLGGLVGSLVLGRLYMAFGWPAVVAGIGVALTLCLALARRMER